MIKSDEITLIESRSNQIESMLHERLVVLCVGNEETEQWIASSIEPYGGNVYRATELFEALGIYVTYAPDIVVLDSTTAPDLAQQMYSHLRTIDAEPILIFDDSSARLFESQRDEILNRQMSFDVPMLVS